MKRFPLLYYHEKLFAIGAYKKTNLSQKTDYLFPDLYFFLLHPTHGTHAMIFQNAAKHK